MTLAEQLQQERLASYVRLRGGYSIPIAGAAYWLALGLLGSKVEPQTWSLIAFIFSGTIFPVAIVLSKLLRNDFLKDRTAVSGVLLPAFLSMFLFWPMALAAYWNFNQLTPLILAIGMSIHWPVIGWSYGRATPYIAHAVARAAIVFGIWQFMPDARFTLLPLSVAAIYVVTVIVIYIDSGLVGRSLARNTESP